MESPIPIMLQMKFDYDWPACLRDIYVESVDRWTARRMQDGRRLESHTISSSRAFGSGGLKMEVLNKGVWRRQICLSPSVNICFFLTVARRYFFCGSFLLFVFHVFHAVLSVPCSLVVTCCEKADFLVFCM